MGDLKFIPAVSQPDLLALCEPHPALAATRKRGRKSE
jgi:hypothetical protein